MSKNYQVKVYTYGWSYKTTISPAYVMNDFRFTKQINGGLWQASINLALPITNTSFEKSDIVTVTCFDENNLDGRLLYSGYITRIKRFLQPDGEYIELSCLGLYSLLKRLFYYNASNVFSETDEPATIYWNIIDYFNSIYTWNRFTYTWVQTYWTNISIDFAYTNCLTAIKQIQALTSTFYYYIWADWNLIYRDKLDVWITNHRLKVENQIDSMAIDEEIETSYNNLYVEYWTAGLVWWPYTDALSISDWWRIDAKAWDQSVSDLTTANIYGSDAITENKEPKNQITLTVNSKYDIESIEPWHTITLLNTDYVVDKLQIQRVSYTYDKVVLNVNKYQTLSESILWINSN